MKRRQFVKSAAALPLAGSAILAENIRSGGTPFVAEGNEVYELRRYELKFGRPQQDLEAYFQDALIPALNRQGIEHIGVFTELGISMPVVLFVLTPHKNVESFYMASQKLASDTVYVEASRVFESKTSQEATYSRYDTWVLRAFDGLKNMVVPDTSADRIFELRTYQGHNDDAVTRKMAMFDREEIPLFFTTKLNPVFFGKMMSGPAMPALTYMITFKNMAERDANWDVFVNHPDWLEMRARPEYADTVSNIIRIFLKPTAYSQV